MLLCEHAIRDAATGRVSLIGIHGEISSERFPFIMPDCYVYARLTDASGSYDITLALVRRNDLSEVAAGHAGQAELSDPLEEFEVVAKLTGIVLAEPGHYDVRLWVNARFVHSVSLHAREVQSGEEDPQ